MKANIRLKKERETLFMQLTFGFDVGLKVCTLCCLSLFAHVSVYAAYGRAYMCVNGDARGLTMMTT